MAVMLGLFLGVVIAALFIVSDGKLVLLWEVRCPDCGEVVLRERELDCRNVWCPRCEKTVGISVDTIYPLFNISLEYKEHVNRNRFRRLVFSSVQNNRRDGPVSDPR